MSLYKDKVRRNWYCFLLGPLFMTLEAAGEFLLPFFNAALINYGAATGDRAYILRTGILMLVIAAGMLLTGVLGAFFAVRGAARMAAGVRQETFEKIQTFSFAEIDGFSTGSLITRVTNDITQIQNFTQSLLRGCFRSPIMLVGALVMSFLLSPRIAWMLLVVVLVLALTTFGIIKTASPRYVTMQKQLDSLNTGIEEAVTNHRVIKAFVREEYEKSRFASINRGLLEKSIHALKMMILLQPVSTLAINVTTLLVVWTAGRQIMVGDMEIGTLTAFITYLSQVLTSLNFLANIFLQGTRAAASHNRIREVMETQPTILDPKERGEQEAFVSVPQDPAEDCTDSLSGDITFREVSFSYFKDQKTPTLKKVSFTIKAGDFVGIIGSTGSGKTTLVSLIPRLYDADRGEVLVGGRNVREIPLKTLRKRVSVVLQQNTLFSGTIEDNLRWGKEDATPEEMVHACQIAQAHSFITSFPDGYRTRIGQGGSTLSGGQKQRLCIARALLKEPGILILDDSTSAVDTKTDEAIRRALEEKLTGVTRLVIAQRISSIMGANQIIVLEKGAIAGVGTHEQLLQSCVPYQEIYYSQKDREEGKP